jgi:hypothetical protein
LIAWLSELAREHLAPQLVEFESCLTPRSSLREAYWIHQYLDTTLNTQKKLSFIP